MMTARIMLAATLALAPAAMFAQAATPIDRQTIHERKTDQHQRINQGVRSGQLTRREAGRLHHQEAGINREERGMRAQNHGHLTNADKTLLNKQQNQESKRIYADKHNSRTR